MKKIYSTNLIDSQYDTILAIIGDTRKRQCSLNDIFDAIMYLLRTGCQWRMLPSDFPKWQLGYYYFRKWSIDETIVILHDSLRDKVRLSVDRNVSLNAGAIDSWSTKGTFRGQDRGIDAGKKVKGRKRHIVTDTQGLVLAINVHAANKHGSKAALEVIGQLKGRHKRLKKIYADGGYRGNLVNIVKKETVVLR